MSQKISIVVLGASQGCGPGEIGLGPSHGVNTVELLLKSGFSCLNLRLKWGM